MRGFAFVEERFRETPFLEPAHLELRERAIVFSAAHPVVEEEDATARSLVGAMGKSGFLAHSGGTDIRSMAVLRETFAFHHGLLDLAFAMQGLGSYAIEIAGSAALKEEVLPRVRSGEWVAAFAVTEAEAGSDLPAVKTSATLRDGRYVLDGRKTFISNAPIADVITVLARTDPAGGSRGMGMFVVRAGEGVRLVRRQEAIAYHPLGELEFKACSIPQERILGKPGEGYRIALAVLETFRATVAAAALGMAGRAIAETVDHVMSRAQFGSRLADLAVVQTRLADMVAQYEAARLLVYRAAARKDGGAARIPLESASAKLVATESAQEIIDMAVQLHGGRGVVRPSPVERLYREIRALRIYEGASDILRLVIAAHVLK